MPYSHDGWDIEFLPLPKSPAARGKPGIRPLGTQLYEPRMVDNRTPLRDAILDKAKRYGQLGRPYVIAVNTGLGSFLHTLDDIDIMEALFGKEQYVFASDHFEDKELRLERVRDGAWIGEKGPRNTRVSAVIVASRLRPWNIAQSTPRVYYNPWADWPCQDELTLLPRAIPEGDRMKYEQGLSSTEIFGLSHEWPGPES
jgi:hypothetical protein